MAACLISDITVRDRTAIGLYRTRAADAIHSYGGRYLARLGEVHVLEGSWNPNVIVIVEIPTWNRLVHGIARPSTHLPWRCTTKRSAATSFSLMGEPTCRRERQRDLRRALEDIAGLNLLPGNLDRMTLQDKTALLTGASRGIGRATALALAGAGPRVVVHYGKSRREARFGQPFDPRLRLNQGSIRDSGQKLGCHSWA